jgi:hypothetical protein
MSLEDPRAVGPGSISDQYDQEEEEAAWVQYRRKNTMDYIFSISFLPPQFDPSGLPLAELECPHGRLAGDPTKPCGCYPEENSPRNGQ